MRVRAIGAAAGLAMALAAVASPVVAVPSSQRVWMPTIDEPRAGDVLHNEFVAEARSTASRVEFVLESDQGRSITVSADVLDGVATAVIPAWGFSGPVRVRARDCTGSVCGDLRSSPSRLTVVNDPVTVSAPSADTDVTAGETSVPVSVSGPGGFLKLTVDGDVALTGDGSIATSLDLSGRPNGVYRLAVQRCNPVAHGLCDPRIAMPVVRVLRTLDLRSDDRPAPPFSPNGDGVRDNVSRHVTFLPGWAPALDVTAQWTLTNHSGDTVAAGPIEAAPGARGADYVIDPAAVGATLDDGAYDLRVEASAVFDGQLIVGALTPGDPIVVDTQAPTADGTTMSVKSFDPGARRGARSVTGTVDGEAGARAAVEILDADGDVVVSAQDTCGPGGGASFRWNGTTERGSTAPAGRYRMRWTLTDKAGNQAAPVKSAWVRLVRGR